MMGGIRPVFRGGVVAKRLSGWFLAMEGLFEVAGEYGLAFAQSQAAGLGGDGVGILIEAVAVARRAGDGGGDDDGFASIADFVSGWVFDDFIGLAGALVQTFGIG